MIKMEGRALRVHDCFIGNAQLSTHQHDATDAQSASLHFDPKKAGHSLRNGRLVN